MNTKSMVWVGMIVGSTIGGYIPIIWGGSLLSFASIIMTAVGGFLGIYIAFKISNLLS